MVLKLYLINDKIQISSKDSELLDDLSKKILNDFIKEFEKLSVALDTTR